MKKIIFLILLTLFTISFSSQTYLYDNDHVISKNYSVLMNLQCEKAQKEVGVIFQIFVFKVLKDDPYQYLLKKFNEFPKKDSSIFVLLLSDKSILRTISAKKYTNIINTNKAFNSNLWSRKEYSDFLYYYTESLMQDIYNYKGVKFDSLRGTISLGSSHTFSILIMIALLIGGGGIFYHRIAHDVHKCPNCKGPMEIVYKTEKTINLKKVYETKYKCKRCGYEYVKISRR
jgi:predicted RNA-binding Zn-ribbon protein involved in translation (DUF1610 family)